MSGWPIALGLGQGGPVSFLLDGLAGGAVSTLTLNLRRTLRPATISGYAGRDFPALSVAADDVFGIDLGWALDAGDSLDPGSLEVLFFPVDTPVSNYATALDGAPGLIGTVAAQAIGQPPAGRYALGFSCGTVNGRRIAIHSFFNAVGLPDAA
jgi:hypothetical protein